MAAPTRSAVSVTLPDAGTAVVTALRAIGERLDALEPAAIADEPDAVHQLRTQVRRLRSVVAAYAPLFDASAARALRRTYGQFGKELGTVRDIEVRAQVAERELREASAASDASLDAAGFAADAIEAVRARLIESELAAHRLAHTRFAARQRMPRAAARRVEVAVFLAAPPLTPLAAEPATGVLGDLVEREARRALRRAAHLTPSADQERLHAVRKAGRRLRYAAEAVTEEPVVLFDERVRSLATAGEQLHDLLGDHRDEVLFAEHVRRSAAHAAHDGESIVAFDRLAEAAERRAADRLGRLDDVVRDLRRAEGEWAAR
ncbi:CHAD domain-containing protein [Agromyces sp. ISL-38]|uniref:CHAD domain-containing protein n=1 Tax=Agromyces sp. ISL-38 TaxID=2819107 RepID=UPI001BEA3363|nr:CHAD domain-containing protein [Agromyces sp. ISL-38]MBT2498346.1 CHAD domain-containing protein [Agromyces sp. ISL-38]